MMVFNRVEKEKTTKRKPRGSKWAGVKSKTKKMFSNEIDLEKNYTSRPYSYTPDGIPPLQYYVEEGK